MEVSEGAWANSLVRYSPPKIKFDVSMSRYEMKKGNRMHIEKKVGRVGIAMGLMVTMIAGQAWSRPAMNVLTINTADPMSYMQWVKGSGQVIGDSINAAVGGVCLPSAGYYGPGEIYYWHLFGDHATAMGAEQYNPSVLAELKKLKAKRVVSRGDAYSVVMAEPGDYEVGQTFANWNVVVSTQDPVEYVSEVKRMSAAADENGFSDIRFTVYSYLTGENAGKLMAVIEAPDGNRLGAMLDALETEWASKILGDMAKIRRYDHGFTMNCEVVQTSGS